jgi:formate dehydrogenase major subunit
MNPLAPLARWPLLRQAGGHDRAGLAAAVQSPRTREARARETGAKVTPSVCPYCAVGCGQLVYSRAEEIVQIEGDPDSPISRGRLCPKGSASKSLVTSPLRERTVKYRRPHGTAWEDLSLDRAMDMIADRVIAARDEGWQDADEEGRTLRRTMGLANLGGATLDNEENYLIKKLMTGLGVVQVENQARI